MSPFKLQINLRNLFSIPETKKQETTKFLNDYGFNDLLYR